jgi:hypothetical protein
MFSAATHVDAMRRFVPTNKARPINPSFVSEALAAGRALQLQALNVRRIHVLANREDLPVLICCAYTRRLPAPHSTRGVGNTSTLMGRRRTSRIRSNSTLPSVVTA